MLARRSIFGLAAGGVAALADRGRSNARFTQSYPQAVGYTGDCAAQSVGGYVESAARQLLNTKINEANESHERKARRLGRLKSISQAFVDAQYMGHNSLVNALYKQLGDTR